MSPPPSPTRSAARRRRLRRIAVSLIVLAGLAAVGWSLRANLLERIVTSLARSRAGLDVRFEGLELEGLARLRAARVVATARTESEVLRSAEIGGLEVEVDVRGLWSDSVLVRSVRARSADVHVDARRAPPSAPGRGPPDLRLPAEWPAVAIDALELRVDAAAGSAGLRGARLALGASRAAADRAGDGVPLELDARTLALRGADGRSVAGALSVRAAARGAGVAIDAARWEGLADVRSAQFAPGDDGGFEARVDAATAIGSATLEARSDARAIRIRGALERVELARVLHILGVESDEFGGAWSARGSCVVPLADAAGWTADADIAAVEPRIAARDADAVQGRFLATAATFEARDVLVLAGANAAFVDLVRVPRDTDLGCEFLERATIVLDADVADAQSILGDAWRIPAGAPPHRVRLRAALADRWLQVERARAEVGASVAEVGPTRFPLGAGARVLLTDPSTEIELAIRAPDSAELARLLLPAESADGLGLSGAVSGSVRLRSTDAGLQARLALRAREAVIRGIGVDELTLRAAVQSGILSVERADLRAGTTSITARGDVDVRARRFAGLDVEADVPDLREACRALGVAGWIPAGHARLRARLDGPIAAPEGTLAVDAADLALGGVDVAWVRLRAHGESGGIAVDELAALLPLAGTITAAGRVDRDASGPWTVDLSRLDVVALEGAASLARPARVVVAPAGIAIEGFDLAGGEGALRVSASRAGDSLCADVAVGSARVGRILRAFGAEVPASLRADGRATLQLVGFERGALDGSVDAELGLAVLDLAEVGLPHGFEADGRADARIALSGGWRDPAGVVEVAAHDLEVRDATGFARLKGAEFRARARVGGEIDFDSFALELSRDARVDASGSIGWPLDLDRLARGDVGGILDAPVDLLVRAEAPDLGPLADAFDLLRRTEGSLSADLAVRGTVAAPSPTGRVLLRDGGVKFSAALPSISGVEVDVALDAGRLAIERAVGTYGGGQIEVSGTVDVSGAEPSVDVALRGKSVPLLRSAEVSLRSDIDVRVNGGWSALALTGTAKLSDARFEQRLDLDRLRSLFQAKQGAGGRRVLELPAIEDPPFDSMRMQIDVRSDTPVRVRTPLLQAQVLTRFSIRGTGANPLLQGSVELDGGRIALPASKLDLSGGRVDFDPNDPGRAQLDVTAEGRVSGYDVRARVTGATDEPVIELTSIPPATQEDLALLLLAGRMPGARGIGIDQERVVGEVASYVARDLAYEWFGDAGESFADRLEMATGADVTQAGADTIEVRFRLAGPARGPGKTVYLRGERDVYDRVNMGVRFVLRMP